MRSRNFCFTVFAPSEKLCWDYKEELKKLCGDTIKGLSYVVAGRETCPETKKIHWQCYCEFDNAINLKSAQTRLGCGQAHMEKRMGTAKQASDYCKKEDEEPFEFGELSRQGRRSDLAEIFHSIKERNMSKVEIADEFPTLWAYHRKALEEYRELKEEKRNWKTEVIFVTGPAGSGKTSLAYENHAVPVRKFGEFYNGYKGEDVVLFDDVDPFTFGRRDELLQLLDRYPMEINIKGGSRNWKPRKIYITSNFTIEELGWNYAAMERRITEVINLHRSVCTEVNPQG